MDTYVDIVKKPEVESSVEEQIIDNGPPKIVLTPLEMYLCENDLLLYDFTNEMKEYWEFMGFLTDLKHTQVSNVLSQCLIVHEISDSESEGDDSDYESAFDDY